MKKSVLLFGLSFAALAIVSFVGSKRAAVLHILRTETGKAEFRSDASLERIEARSKKLRGAIDIEQNEFAFSVDIASFEGFNSPLQREHFNENYMETAKFPRATFVGKLIERPDLRLESKQSVRAKGIFTMHGVERERILRTEIEARGASVFVRSKFSVALADHEIAIPRLVNQKIAEEISVSVDAELK